MTRRARKITRSAITFTVGLAGVAAETVYSLRFQQTPDSALLLIFVTMMGLPVYFSQDSKGHKDDPASSVDDEPTDEPRKAGDHGTS